jgi:hypothetical protein
MDVHPSLLEPKHSPEYFLQLFDSSSGISDGANRRRLSLPP